MENKNYDDKYLENLNQLFFKTKQRSFELLNINKNDIVADVGCGIGADVFEIAKKAYKVYGFDNDENFISISKKKENNINVSFEKCNAENLSIENQSVDKLRYDRVIQHLPDYNAVLKEASRVIKDNGIIQIIDTDYLSISLFLDNIRLERKLIDLVAFEKIPNSTKIRNLNTSLEDNNFKVTCFEVHNYIFYNNDLINEIIRFDKIINDEYLNEKFSLEEFDYWNSTKNDRIMSLNLLIIQALKK